MIRTEQASRSRNALLNGRVLLQVVIRAIGGRVAVCPTVRGSPLAPWAGHGIHPPPPPRPIKQSPGSETWAALPAPRSVTPSAPYPHPPTVTHGLAEWVLPTPRHRRAAVAPRIRAPTRTPCSLRPSAAPHCALAPPRMAPLRNSTLRLRTALLCAPAQPRTALMRSPGTAAHLPSTAWRSHCFPASL